VTTDTGSLVLTPKGARAVHARHHWIFSGAVKRMPEAPNGSTVPVLSSEGEHLGWAYFNQQCSLRARMVSFGNAAPLDALRAALVSALEVRRRLLDGRTNAYRIVNAEADGIPGLIVDRYGEVLVIQIGTLGMDLLRDSVIGLLAEVCSPACVFERSDAGSRKEEGLEPRVGWVTGSPTDPVEIHEDGLRFRVTIAGSQKTGFYLDQRESRALVRAHAAGRRVLDCFCYAGGFSVAALAGGARDSTLVDSSVAALESARVNLELNGAGSERARTVREDVFRYLGEAPLDQDLVILDPPAFAKTRHEVSGALRGYHAINRMVLARVRPGTLVLTCSCSYHVDAALFQTTVFQAAREAGRPVRIIHRHRLASDHPINIFHPETEYLKSLLLWVG
jgi:23S rRNA (cytosine1962-C5)-methyltransferase